MTSLGEFKAALTFSRPLLVNADSLISSRGASSTLMQDIANRCVLLTK